MILGYPEGRQRSDLCGKVILALIYQVLYMIFVSSLEILYRLNFSSFGSKPFYF